MSAVKDKNDNLNTLFDVTETLRLVRERNALRAQLRATLDAKGADRG